MSRPSAALRLLVSLFAPFCATAFVAVQPAFGLHAVHLSYSKDASTGNPQAVAIAAGDDDSFALLSNGTVMAWGLNVSGDLGNGTTTTSSDVPMPVSKLSNVKAVSAGANFTLALLHNGTVMAWGHNGAGELGDGSTVNSDLPVQVSGLSGVTAIAAGQGSSLAVLSNGTVMAWGSNGLGQLGIGTTSSQGCECVDQPVAVPGLSGVSAVAVGNNAQSFALLADGTLMGWGHNDYQLGDGDISDTDIPVSVSQLSRATGMAVGGFYGLALEKSGTLMGWGINETGVLAVASRTYETDVAVPIPGVSSVKEIAGGSTWALALRRNGTVLAWGDNGGGQLGDGSVSTNKCSCVHHPASVPGLSQVTAVAGGSDQSLALLSDGTVMSWGSNTSGQLGNGTTTNSASPVEVSGIG